MKIPRIRFRFGGTGRPLLPASLFLALLFLILLFLVRGGALSGRGAGKEAGSLSSQEGPATASEIKRLSGQLLAEEMKQALSNYQNLGIIQCASYINFRSKPNQTDITNIMGMLKDGAAVDVEEIDPEGAQGWAHVRSGGMDGYISTSFLLGGEEAKEKAKTLLAPRAKVLADKLRIRSTPEISDGNTVGSAAAGETYQLIGRAGRDWVEITVDNIDGISSAYMSADPENVSLDYGLDEARSLNLKQKVLNLYDRLGVSKAGDYINIRSSPEEDGIRNIVGKFPGFAGGNILGEENGWYKIQSGGVTGYVKAELVATGAEAERLAVDNAQVMAIVNTNSLNVRSEPSTESRAWTQITKDQRYLVVNQLDGWVQLDLDSGDDDDGEQGAYVSTRDNNVSVTYGLQEAVEYHPALEAANAAMERRNQIVNFACQFVGNRYVWGGTSLTHGADCSGFTQSVMKNFDIYLPRVSREQARTGVKVDSGSMRPGDLIFYANRSGRVNHVGIYIGNGQVVNAASRRSGIRIYRWNYRTPVAIRNVIGD